MAEHRDDLTWRISFPRAAFEKRHDDPARDYGIGSVRAHFVLSGPAGALSFEVSTGWYLPHVAERLRKEANHRRSSPFEPSAGAVYWHHVTPQWDGHDVADDCQLVEGGRCYCDVGYLAGDTMLAALIEGGEEGLRTLMEEWYVRDLESPAPNGDDS